MTTTKKGAFFNLSEKVIENIKKLASGKKMSQGELVEYLVERYFEERSEEHKLLKDTLASLLDEKMSDVKEDLNRIRVTSNVIDRNIQMELEFWNHYFIVNDFHELGSTEKYKTPEMIEAEKVVKNRIAHLRQRKLDWEDKRNKHDES